MIYRTVFKRIIDVVTALICLIVLSPIIALVAILLCIANNGRPFFVQQRPGRYGKIFKVIKFKTMNDRKDASGNLLPDSVRLTRLGKFIRASSLDELPQLFNVLIGDMSLIGPRPLLVKYLPLYNAQQSRRHEVRPGITGWAQVNGRNAISWEQRFLLDVYYVDNLSFALDIKIVYLTGKKVLKREGINADATTTMKPFTGN
jgi:undecaprenyl phosphate N,N'-diacetylbacillosamine 1-phosphate transferase